MAYKFICPQCRGWLLELVSRKETASEFVVDPTGEIEWYAEDEIDSIPRHVRCASCGWVLPLKKVTDTAVKKWLEKQPYNKEEQNG